MRTGDTSEGVPERPRVLGLVEGPPDVALSGITLRILGALERHADVVGIVDYAPKGARRAILAAATVRPRRATWRGRFHTSPAAHRMLTSTLSARTRDLERNFDVALQIHGWTHGQPRPFTVFVDQTRLMADRGWPAWMPLQRNERAGVLDRERAMYETAHHLFVMGKPAQLSLVEEYGVHAGKITVVGGGLNFDDIPPPRAPTLDPVVLFVGREFERKGGQVLLEAFELVREEVPDATLHIAGARPRIDRPGIVVHGPLSDRSALMDLFRSARVFCLPSIYEPWGFVFTEAQALGVPCVGTAVQSIPHLLRAGEAGLVVPPRDPVRLADALVRLLRDDDLALRLARSGREWVEEQFTWDQVARRMLPGLEGAG